MFDLAHSTPIDACADKHLAGVLARRLNEYVEPDLRRVELFARTPASPIAAAVWSRLDTLKAAHWQISAIFSDAVLRRDMVASLAPFVQCFGSDFARGAIRIARFLDERDIVEQLTLATGEIWSASAPCAEPQCVWAKQNRNSIPTASAAFAFGLMFALSEPLRPTHVRRALREAHPPVRFQPSRRGEAIVASAPLS